MPWWSSSPPLPNSGLHMLPPSSTGALLRIPVEGTHVNLYETTDPLEMKPEYSMILACMIVPLDVIKANHKMHDNEKHNPPHEQSMAMYTCPICHEDGTEHQVPPLLPCNHRFHRRCLENWFMYSSPPTRRSRQQQQGARDQAEPQSPQGEFDAFAAGRLVSWAPPVNERPTCPVCRREMMYACGHVFQAGLAGESLDHKWHPDELRYPCYGAPSQLHFRLTGPLTKGARSVKRLYDEAKRLKRYDLEDSSNFANSANHNNSRAAASSNHNVKPTSATTVPIGTGQRLGDDRDTPFGRRLENVQYPGPKDNPVTPQMGPLIDDHPLSWILTWAAWGAKIYNAEHPFMLGFKTWEDHLDEVIKCIRRLSQSQEVEDRLEKYYREFWRLEITLDRLQRRETALIRHEKNFDGKHTDESLRTLEVLILRCRKSRDEWHIDIRRTRRALQHFLNCREVHLAAHKLQKLCNTKSCTAKYLPWLWRRRLEKIGISEEMD